MNPEESRLLLLNAPVLPSSLNSSTGQGTTRIWYTDFFIAVKVYASIQNPKIPSISSETNTVKKIILKKMELNGQTSECRSFLLELPGACSGANVTG